MTHVTCRLTAKKRDQLRNPTLGNRVWATFIFIPVLGVMPNSHHRRRLAGAMPRCSLFSTDSNVFHLSAGDVADVGRSVEGVVAGHVPAGEDQTPVFTSAVTETDDRACGEQVR